jgi:hypothetical protein
VEEVVEVYIDQAQQVETLDFEEVVVYMAQDQLVEILDFKEVVKRVKTLDMVVADYIKEFDMVLVFVD